MKVFKAFLFTLISFLFCISQLQAQNTLFDSGDFSKVNIDNYSDEEIISFYNKAVNTGLSEEDLYRLAVSRGMADTEIAKLKKRIEAIREGNPTGQDVHADRKTSLRNLRIYDSSGAKIPLQKFMITDSVFGAELFTSNSLTFEPNLRIPAPAGYILGPDDEVIINVYGYSEKKYTLTVNEEGEIYIPNVGPVLVNGLTLEEATEKIKSKLASTIYTAIRTGGTRVQVTLGKIRSIRVTVIGQAKRPGSYTVSSLTTLYNILYLCGGPSAMGSFRNIEVIRSKGQKKVADLYDFLAEGDQQGNILLQEGDVVRIPYYKNRVSITGKVKRKGKFEMKDGETFADLLRYCGGFTDDAFRGTVGVERITDTEKKIFDVRSDSYDSFRINGSDKFFVRKLQDEFGNRIVISGAVNRPGPYELDPGLTLDAFIQKAGGLTRDAYTSRISIFRYLKNKMPTILSVNYDSVENKGLPVQLQKDDSVAVHSIFEFHDSTFVSVVGNVRKPGPVYWRENLSLKDVLLSVGGISETGDSATIEISRRIKKADIDQLNHPESRIYNINLTSAFKARKDFILEPYDIVIIKTLPGYGPQRTILLTGEVKSPGKYSLGRSEDRISDIIQRSGGFKASADSSAITIRRPIRSTLTIEEREKLFQRVLNVNLDSLALNPRLRDELYKTYDLISIDLKTALKKPSGPENLVLEDGDILTVDRSSDLVKVSGEVYNPTIVSYQSNKTLKYYVQQAGNFTSYARKNGALVIHPDGKTKSVKHFLFFRSYPSVTPRSEIFVPQKNKDNRSRLGTGELALIVSALGILANVIINLTK